MPITVRIEIDDAYGGLVVVEKTGPCNAAMLQSLAANAAEAAARAAGYPDPEKRA